MARNFILYFLYEYNVEYLRRTFIIPILLFTHFFKVVCNVTATGSSFSFFFSALLKIPSENGLFLFISKALTYDSSVIQSQLSIIQLVFALTNVHVLFPNKRYVTFDAISQLAFIFPLSPFLFVKQWFRVTRIAFCICKLFFNCIFIHFLGSCHFVSD